MPTYEYACTKCGEHVEAYQAFTDDPLTECPSCGGELRKVFGSVGIVFKGSGFYKNDSRSTSTATKKADSTGSTSSGDKSPDSAPASSAESTSTATPAAAASTSTTSTSSPT